MRLRTRLLALLAAPALLAWAIDATAAAPAAVYEAPYAGCLNHAVGAPPFRWGYFGAEHVRPPTRFHRDYNGYTRMGDVYRRY